MFEPLKITYINKEEILEDFIKENPEYIGKELTFNLYSNSYNIKYKKKLLHLVQALDGYEFKETGRVYGYARISRPQQSIERQIRNIKSYDEAAHIVEEAYTGTKMDRPKWLQLYKKVQSGDTIIFDSVSRMSRSADEGVEIYFELYEKGIQLVFLKEHHIDTATYDSAVQQSIASTGNDIADIYIEATNKVIKLLAKKQIIQAFEQSEKEVEDLHQRTREGIETARLNGKQIGRVPGIKLHIKKEAPAKEKILKYSKSFNGELSDPEVITLTGLSRNTYYKYKRQLKTVNRDKIVNMTL